MNNYGLKDGTAVDITTKAEVPTVSQTIAKPIVIGSGFSVWETYTDEQLKSKLETMQNEHEYLTDVISKAERELFYRTNPECRVS